MKKITSFLTTIHSSSKLLLSLPKSNTKHVAPRWAPWPSRKKAITSPKGYASGGVSLPHIWADVHCKHQQCVGGASATLTHSGSNTSSHHGRRKSCNAYGQ